MANLKYTTLGNILSQCIAWAPAGQGIGNVAHGAPEVLLMLNSYTASADHDIIGADIVPHIAGRADLTNPTRNNRTLMADVTLINGASGTVGTDMANGIIIAADFYNYSTLAYTKRPMFYLDDNVSAQLPYQVSGHAVTIMFPSNILYTI